MTTDLARCDLLLLNRSNLPSRPIFPYAFVQVRALARQHGIAVASFDLMGVPQAEELGRLRTLLDRTRPRLVGLHLRQADTLVYQDYEGPAPRRYHPVEDTADTIANLRGITDVPITVGGFGFSTHPERLLRRLGPDFGVVGDPSPLFERFDDVLAGQRDAVDNLVFARGTRPHATGRHFGAPLPEREYDDAIVDSMERFYGTSVLFGANPPTVAVELARGCPYRCYFCSEPAVKGRRPRERDLDVVMGDVEFLAARGIHKIWLVCSELNIGRPDLALKVAERFLRLNEGRAQPIRWRAYRLPRWLSRCDLALLQRSGYAGGWNDFPALDDETLKKTGVPYRVRHAVPSITDELDLATADVGAYAADFSMFLGNAFATPESIARTLAQYHAAGLYGRFTGAEVAPATRLFAPSGLDFPGADEPQSFGRDGPTAPDLALPTFAFTPSLVAAAGSRGKLLRLFEYIRTTLLSQTYRAQLDWVAFLTESTTPEWVAQQLADHGVAIPRLRARGDGLASEVQGCLRAIGPGVGRWAEVLASASVEARQRLAMVVVTLLDRLPVPRRAEILAVLGLPDDVENRSPYATLVALLRRFSGHAELFDTLEHRLDVGPRSLEAWAVRRLLFEKNLILDPAYRRFIVPARQPNARTAAAKASPRSAKLRN